MFPIQNGNLKPAKTKLGKSSLVTLIWTRYLNKWRHPASEIRCYGQPGEGHRAGAVRPPDGRWRRIYIPLRRSQPPGGDHGPDGGCGKKVPLQFTGPGGQGNFCGRLSGRRDGRGSDWDAVCV